MIRVGRREPAALWTAPARMRVITTATIGFAGAAEDDRRRWLNGFRRLLDGLDAPLQVVIDVEPGSGQEEGFTSAIPSGYEDMRGADMCFAEEIRRSHLSHRVTTSLTTDAGHCSRVQAALTDMGIQITALEPPADIAFGRELTSCFQNSRGFSRAWYVERLPGTDLDPGWLFRLLPPRLGVSLAWHAVPLPAAWIVSYLQRQLINMRATQLVGANGGIPDPSLAGALPNTEDLQRRLASSQDKAFHVSVYLSLTAPTIAQLELGSRRIESAAQAILCQLQPCTFRMLDGYVATQPGGEDRLQRKRVLDSTALVTFFPWHEPDLQEAAGVFIGRNRATGAPVLIDTFDQSRYANANIGVFGHSGAGKTYLLSTLAMGALGRGIQVYIVDPEHEYGTLALELGGVDVRLALGSGHALNVLDLRPSDRRDEGWLGPAICARASVAGLTRPSARSSKALCDRRTTRLRNPSWVMLRTAYHATPVSASFFTAGCMAASARCSAPRRTSTSRRRSWYLGCASCATRWSHRSISCSPKRCGPASSARIGAACWS